jgi:hypothetical protein
MDDLTRAQTILLHFVKHTLVYYRMQQKNILIHGDYPQAQFVIIISSDDVCFDSYQYYQFVISSDDVCFVSYQYYQFVDNLSLLGIVPMTLLQPDSDLLFRFKLLKSLYLELYARCERIRGCNKTIETGI